MYCGVRASIERVGASRFFATRALALSEIYTDAHQDSKETRLPLPAGHAAGGGAGSAP